MPAQSLQPTNACERVSTLDILRGIALFGVLTINLLDFFRLSLWTHILHFHSDPGPINHAIDAAAAFLIEFKAFYCFALAFGIGIAIQSERAARRGTVPEWFLLRRFLVLLAIGALHMLLISNVDILMLYAVCGFILILFIRVPAPALAIAGIAAIYLPTLLPLPAALPDEAGLRYWSALATATYSHGTLLKIVAFRWRETVTLIVPLLAETAQTVVGLMLLGMAVWRFRIVQDPVRFQRFLWIFAAVAGSAGLLNTFADLAPELNAPALHLPGAIRMIGSYFPLALAYAAVLFAWRDGSSVTYLTARFAAAGQMALTNYVTQSLVLSTIFYGYGFAMFGRVAPAPAMILALGLYGAQLELSYRWLQHFRFGPCEWLWRSATYAHLQPMRRCETPSAMIYGVGGTLM